MRIDADLTKHDPAAPPLSRRRMAIALGIVALVLLAILLAVGRHRAPAPRAEAAQQRVTVTVPGRHSIAASVNASGIIAARHDMPVGVVGEGGRVAEVLVYPGDWVKAGQPLAVIERSVQIQQVAGLASQVAAAGADARLAQANLDRARGLVRNGFISKADIDAKTAARDQAVARVAVARAQLGEQQARNARLVIRAPAGGLVLTRTVEPGQIVNNQTNLFRVAERGDMELLARVAEQDLARMHVGTGVEVMPIGSGKGLRGQVWQLSPIIDPATRQGIARVALGYDPALRPGGFANARIASGSADVPLLPESAVLSDARGNYVLIVGRGNAVERRAVTVGEVGDAGVSIAAGLAGTEQVVVSAGAFLSPGEKILPERAPSAR